MAIGHDRTPGKVDYGRATVVTYLSVDFRCQESWNSASTEVTMTKQPKAKPVAQNKGNIVVAFMHAALFATSLWMHPVVTAASADRSLA